MRVDPQESSVPSVRRYGSQKPAIAGEDASTKASKEALSSSDSAIETAEIDLNHLMAVCRAVGEVADGNGRTEVVRIAAFR